MTRYSEVVGDETHRAIAQVQSSRHFRYNGGHPLPVDDRLHEHVPVAQSAPRAPNCDVMIVRHDETQSGEMRNSTEGGRIGGVQRIAVVAEEGYGKDRWIRHE